MNLIHLQLALLVLFIEFPQRKKQNGFTISHEIYSMNNFNPKNYIVDNNLIDIYSYILGLYLGDGHIVKTNRTYRLRIFNTIDYENLNKFIIGKLQKLFAHNKINYVDFMSYISIYVYSNKLPQLFPQHGSGKKQDRKIEFLDWQNEIINHKHLFAGLLHSDGSIYNDRKYRMCDFTNYSEDILNIYKLCLDNLNLNYTTSKHRIFIRNRPDILWIEENIGDKNNINLM